MVARVILSRRPGFETWPRGESFKRSGQSLDSQSLEKEQITSTGRVALAYCPWPVLQLQRSASGIHIHLDVDEYCEWRADQSEEFSAEEKASLNRQEVSRSALAPA